MSRTLVRLPALLGVLSLGLAACGPIRSTTGAPSSSESGTARELTVFAAASLTESFGEIAAAFEAANPGVIVKLSFAGSQTLRAQIEEGAAVDVFASANTKEMNTLVADGMVATQAPRVFLTNELVVILAPGNPGKVESLQDLADPGLKLVLAAEDVPVGAYSRQALAQMDASFGAGFKDNVMARVVSNEEDVKHVVTKVELGEADAGIVYTSDAIAAPDVPTIKIPREYNVIARYPIAPIVRAAHPSMAARFIDFVLSTQGQAILNKWGFQRAD